MGEPIVIGQVGGFSGPISAAHHLDQDTLAAWGQWVNANGGINGHPVKIISKDDRGDPSVSVSMVKSLVEEDHVIALVGVADQLTESSWAPYVKEKGIPVIGGQAATDVWTTNPVFFPGAATYQSSKFGLAAAAKAAGAKTLGMFICTSSPTCADVPPKVEAQADKLGIKWTITQGGAPNAADYTAPCLAMKQADPDAVAMGVDPSTATKLATTCKVQGLHPTYTMVSVTVDSTLASQSVFDGAVGATDVFPWVYDGPETKDFRSAMSEHYPKALSNGNEMVGTEWVAGQLFKAAASKVQGDITSESLLDAMYTLGPNFDLGGLMPPYTYTKGQPTPATPCMFIAKVAGGKWTAPNGLTTVCGS